MKKEELFDTLEDVEQKYISEAFFDDLDEDSPTVARPGKARITPMKIAAPIAACLAVAAAAGFLVVNVGRGKLAVGPAASMEESSEIDETSEPENTEGSELPSKWYFPSRVPAIAEECEDVVMDMFPQLSSSELTWQAESMDVDFDGANELVLCPRVNGSSVKGVGVCVFKINDGNAEYVGSFGSEFTSMDLKNIYYIEPNSDAKFTYYFNINEENEKCVTSIQKLYLEDGIVQDETYLRLVRTYSGDEDNETAYCYGTEISTEQLLAKWKSTGIDILPATNDACPHHGNSDNIQLLVDKYNVPLAGGSLNSLHRYVMSADINGDGEDETVIQFRNCEQLPGTYVFSADGRLIGELNLEGDRGGLHCMGGNDTLYYTPPAVIQKYESDSESYYYFHTVQHESRLKNPGYAGVARWMVNKIVVNADSTLDSEVIAEWGSEFVGDEGDATRHINQINGKDVSELEAYAEVNKHPDDLYIW